MDEAGAIIEDHYILHLINQVQPRRVTNLRFRFRKTPLTLERMEARASFRSVYCVEDMMGSVSWADWSIVKLQECYMRGLGPDETAALIGKSKDEVYEKARELGLVTTPHHVDSPSTAPDGETPFPRRIRLRHREEPELPGIFNETQ